MDSVTCGQMVLDAIEKQAAATHGEQATKQYSFMISALVPASGFLPLAPGLTISVINCDKHKPCPPQVVLATVFITATEKQTKTGHCTFPYVTGIKYSLNYVFICRDVSKLRQLERH